MASATLRPYNYTVTNHLIEITDSNFDDEVIRSDTPVLVDFSAQWCAPCKKLEPIVADLARQYENRLKVGHLDIEGSPATAAQFGVMSVPTLIFFKGGKPAQQMVGPPSRQALEQVILKVLA